MKKISLEWRVLDRDHVALVFNRETWRVFEITAEARGLEATDMLAEAVSGLLGEIRRN